MATDSQVLMHQTRLMPLPIRQVVTDPNGAFTRFLGMDQGAPDAAGARSLRYAAVVDDGVLLKVVRSSTVCGLVCTLEAGWGWSKWGAACRQLAGCACLAAGCGAA